jgi:two-component system, NarL family, capsular synthesis sensor histidine kinase RcsC
LSLISCNSNANDEGKSFWNFDELIESNIEYFCKTKSNLHMRFLKTFYENSPAVLVVFKDFSIIKECEKAKWETKFKSVLMSTITHELRTPVNAIFGMIQLLKKYVSDDGLHYLLVSESSAHLLTSLINDILV